MVEKNYSNLWNNKKSSNSYSVKMNSKIEKLRHKSELRIIKKYSSKNLYDCSIANGRFIKDLKNINYFGSDISIPFVNNIKKYFPQVIVKINDLRKGINEPSDKYQTVICFRTLNNIRNKEKVINEMIRITNKNGYVIFSLPKLLKNIKYSYKFKTDSKIFVRIIKKNKLLERLFNSRYNIIPLKIFFYIEILLSQILPSNYIYVIKKNV